LRPSLISDPRITDGRPFDWKEAFPAIIRDGGFDVIVGNPPYGAKVSEVHRRYLESIYDTYEYQFNSYALFYERALGLLKPGGVLGFITPATFTYQHYFRKLRKFLQQFEHDSITKYTYEVFSDADIGDSVVWVCRNNPNLKKSIKIAISDSPTVYSPPLMRRPYEDVVNNDGSYDLRASALNLKRISKLAQPLGRLAKIIVGIKPYQTGKGEPKQAAVDVLEKPFTANYAVDNSFRPCMIGRDFHRYRLLKRPTMYLSYGKWLAEPRESAPFDAAKKIVIRQTADSLIGYLDTEQRINLNNVYNIAPASVDLRAEYLLALINSKLLNYIYQGISQEKGRTFAEVKRVYLAQLPIVIADSATQNIMSDMVNQLISLHETIFEKSESFSVLVKLEYGAGVWSSAVSSWWEMDFTEFAGRLKKRLSLRQKKDLLELYQAYQPELTQAAQLAQYVLTRIEAAVFDVYGLTPEEITIIEQGALH
jgi:TaqI-like C-terminal specificity domain/Eco57I restriction-modification methylase